MKIKTTILLLLFVSSISTDLLAGPALQTIQKRLNQIGYHVGEIDGLWGTNTSRAIMKFQKKLKLPSTGALNIQTIKKLQLDPFLLVAQDWAVHVNDFLITPKDFIMTSMLLGGCCQKTKPQEADGFFHRFYPDEHILVSSIYYDHPTSTPFKAEKTKKIYSKRIKKMYRSFAQEIENHFVKRIKNTIYYQPYQQSIIPELQVGFYYEDMFIDVSEMLSKDWLRVSLRDKGGFEKIKIDSKQQLPWIQEVAYSRFKPGKAYEFNVYINADLYMREKEIEVIYNESKKTVHFETISFFDHLTYSNEVYSIDTNAKWIRMTLESGQEFYFTKPLSKNTYSHAYLSDICMYPNHVLKRYGEKSLLGFCKIGKDGRVESEDYLPSRNK